MNISDETKKRRQEELSECFKVIDTCLACYYNGATHMYRPIAGQLRILLCVDRPLLLRVFPNLKLHRLRPIEYVEPSKQNLIDGIDAQLNVGHPQNQEYRLALMPFRITKYNNGLQIADIILDKGGQTLPFKDWINHSLTDYPIVLSLRDIIKSIANKGGGSHVDDRVDNALKQMSSTGPVGVGLHVLFTIALGRLLQEFGLRFSQFREQTGGIGGLENVIFNPEHPSVKARAKVDDKLEHGERNQFTLTVLKKIRE